MPRFNPIAFLDSLGIEYKVRGNNAYFRCPTCAESDLGSDNFGVRLDGRAWGCWRDRGHNGSLRQLIRSLTGWSYDQIDAYLAGAIETSTVEALRERRRKMHEAEPEVDEELELLPEFRVPQPEGSTARFFRYFERRGFTKVKGLVRTYGILCARTGQFHDRVILPVRMDGKLMGWTARAIGEAEVRYLAHPGSVKDAVFGGDVEPAGYEVLVVVEGPVDALKLGWAALVAKLPVGVVALMGTHATASQTAQLGRLAAPYSRVVIVLDQATRGPARRLRKALSGSCAVVRPLPRPWKDPGEMTMEAATVFLQTLLAA